MSRTKSKIIVSILLVMVLLCAAACQAVQPVVPEVDTNTATNTSGQLEILRSDRKLTQEQVASQIKAKYLLENNGYKDSDDVTVILSLSGKSLIESYNSKYYKSNATVSDYAQSKEGIAQAKSLADKQNELINLLQKRGLISGVEHTYSTIMNGIAVTTKYGNLDKLEKSKYVDSVIMVDTYNRPTEAKDANVVENLVDVYEDTGIFNSASVSYTGKNTAVAVLDSGFDCSHSVFQRALQSDEMLLHTSDIDAVISAKDSDGNLLCNAAKTTEGLQLKDVYYSDKIPFIYDYADKDADAFPYDSEHGTHVAGIIGGKDDVITGVAIDTQLVLMKVFPDLEQGAETDDILAALEDAVLLKVDAINMSLGSSCGFTREEDGNKINEVYDRIYESGISLITAASNDYSSAYGGEQGNTNFVTNPDSATVGSPSTYQASLSVASISGTKSKYITASDNNGNDPYTFFFLESSAINGDENDFLKELYAALRASDPEKYGDLQDGDTVSLDYVTVPGVGMWMNYASIDVKGKIALVRRGSNTFEEKAQNAKKAGAIACIIYNNIDGEIRMSMGKSDHVPTVSISKDDGTVLASRRNGKMVISYNNQAGPFMSDFSSWGPTPSLELKPDITAHGGNIKSSVPGGGYDELSGTSMATPNLCGIVVLIRQYIKDNYAELVQDENGDLSMKKVTELANQLLMSTATIALNEQGNYYSPRKQGAGLASLKKAVTTSSYITVDGTDRTKLELGDDPDRNGVYTMKFNVVNISDITANYTLDLVGMTESVSSSDNTHVAERSHYLDKNIVCKVNGSLSNTVSVAAHSTAVVEITYTLSDSDKNYIDNLFPYGMYVEGYVKLLSTDVSTDSEGVVTSGVDLNVPFLAFYGDWTEAPMFDKTYYEVESEAHNQAIDDEDKIKADYYATTPYGSYYYNYIIPLGSYLYDVDTNLYDEIPATEDHIAVSNILGSIDGIFTVYAGLLRGAKTMTFTITDKVTGEVMYSKVAYNAIKAHSNGATAIPYFEDLNISSYQLGLLNNHEYEFTMKGLLDYGDGGVNTNVRNSFSFDFTADDEAPVIRSVSYEKTYDKMLKKDRYYITMTVYDNHYVQSIRPLILTEDSYSDLTENPIPVNSERGKDTTIRFEITGFLEDISFDELLSNSLAFSIDDYALNSNIFICQLPGTRGDFKFTGDGNYESSKMSYLNVHVGEVVDLTRYLATADATVDENKDYLKHLSWTSKYTDIATIEDGLLKCLKPGTTTIAVTEKVSSSVFGTNGKSASLIVNVSSSGSAGDNIITEDVSKATLQELRFSYFDTLDAFARSGKVSDIGEVGDRNFLSSMNAIGMYPGETIKLAYDFSPWYAESNYSLVYSCDKPNKVIVAEDGTVQAREEGSATITLQAVDNRTGKTSNIMARIAIDVKNPFVIENRILVAYKGLGGEVVIPDDEGILYIGSYAFCLYDTDPNVKVDEDDWDRNKLPQANKTVTSVVIPYGVEEIQKYAFYECSELTSVSIPSTCKYIRERAFYNDEKLTTITVTDNSDKSVGLEGTKVETIAREAFRNCKNLENINLSKVFALGTAAFQGCVKLQQADLTAVRNSGSDVFRDCAALASVQLSENTKLSIGMFQNSGLQSVTIYEKVEIPELCFAECKSLTSVTLPDNNIILGNYSFADCDMLEEVVFGKNTVIVGVLGSIFQNSKLQTFNVHADNANYNVDSANGLLLNKAGDTVIFAPTGRDYSTSTLVLNYANIGDSAFCGVNVKNVEFACAVNVGNFAFSNCHDLETVTFKDVSGNVIGKRAFNDTKVLSSVVNLQSVLTVGEYAFASSGLKVATVGANANYGEGAFLRSAIETITIGANATFGLGAFESCTKLTTVNMPEDGGVHFGYACFYQDTALASIDLSKTDDTIEDMTFFGCTSLTTANLTTVKHIGRYAFAECSKLSTLTIPVAEDIGEGAFSRYYDKGSAPTIVSVTLPDTLKVMGDGVFIGCGLLKEISIPASITKIPDFSFALCVQLSKVTLANEVTEIGDMAFFGCNNLDTINLSKITAIGERAFANAELLSNVDLSSAVTIGNSAFDGAWVSGNIVANNLVSVGEAAFNGCNITSFTATKLESIGMAAFQANYRMPEFVLYDNIKYIGEMAFLKCMSLKSFYFYNGAEKVNNGNVNDYAMLDNGILYTKMASGNLQLLQVPGAMDIDTLNVLEGTYYIGYYAGNENVNIENIVLPDSLKLIANYAFYGYGNLKSVEFRSYSAPALESEYDSTAKLSATDPGYNLLHHAIAIGKWELCYFNFVDLLGKNIPIKMILPANETVEGYDSLVYRVYFGEVANAERSDYIARDKHLVQFYEYAQKVAELKTVTMTNATLINNAVAEYNAIPANQDPTAFGYDAEEWKGLVDAVFGAKETLRKLQLANASKAAQQVQKNIDALPQTFAVADMATLQEIATAISKLTPAERLLLDQTKYIALQNALTAYNAQLDNELQGTINVVDSNYGIASATVAVLSALAAAVVILKRRGI